MGLFVLILVCPVGSFGETLDYTYDDMDRLIRVAYLGGTIVHYIYDGVGNRLARSTALPDSPPNQPPFAPSNPKPSDGSMNVAANVDLVWTGGDPDDDSALFYDIYFGIYPDLPLVKRGHQSTSYYPGPLNALTTYNWKIVSRDNRNAVAQGPIWRFTTGNNPPSTPENPRPVDARSIIFTNVYLSWDVAEDPYADDAVRYDIHFGKSPTPPLLLADHSQSFFDLGTLDPNTNYYWKIISKDDHGARTEGPVWTFETLDHTQTLLDSVTCSTDTVLTVDKSPYIVKGTLTVAQGTTLTIEPGCILKFEPTARLQVDGTLIATGHVSEEIIFTSSMDDTFGGDTNGDRNVTHPSHGDWQRVHLRNGSDNSVIEHAIIQYGENGICVESSSPTIQDSTIQRTKMSGIYIKSGSPLIHGNIIQQNGTEGVYVYSGKPTINGNMLLGNGNYDLYFRVGGSVVTDNTVYNGIYLQKAEFSDFTSNTIHYHSSYPLRLGAENIGELCSSNAVEGVRDGDHVQVIGGTIRQDADWRNTLVWQIQGSLTVQGTDGDDGVTTLRLEPGVVMSFANASDLKVGGSSGAPGALAARGTVSEPIVFTCNQDEPAPGDWNGISFLQTADDTLSVLEHCVVQYGYCGVQVYESSPTIQDSTIQRTKMSGIYIKSGSPLIHSNVIQENGTEGVYVYSGKPTINGNVLLGNGNYDLYFRVGGSVVTGNTVYNGIYLQKAEFSDFTANNIHYSSTYPLRLGVNNVGMLMSNNTIEGLNLGDHVEVIGGTIRQDADWRNTLVWQIQGSLTVQGTDGDDGVTTLRLEPGVVMSFANASDLKVGGSSGAPGALTARGTVDEPIVFTCNQDEPAPGDWNGISFLQTADDTLSVLEHCVVQYGYCGVQVYESSPTIQDSTIQRTKMSGIYIKSGSPLIHGNVLQENGTEGIYVHSGKPTINRNSIFNNDSFGAYNAKTRTIDAKSNWWGDATGPYDPSDDRATGGQYNPTGLGDQVSDYVDYEPWITDPSDMDEDGLADEWEMSYFGTRRAADDNTDNDDDGLLDIEEYLYQTDPGDPDCDDDGRLDGWEIVNGTDPLARIIHEPRLPQMIQE